MRKVLSALVLLALGIVSAHAAEHIVTQKNDHFSVTQLKIKVGDTVHFRNDDPQYHNVFSLTEGHFFELGSYGQGQSRKMTFEKVGKIEVECAIHPAMKLVIEVTR